MSQSLTQLLDDMADIVGVVLHAELTATFAVAIASASIGAFAGAWAAQRIAAAKKSKDDLILEIRNTNAAVSIAFDIFQTYISLKDQFVQPFKKNYAAEKKRHTDFLELQIAATGTLDVLEFEMNFQTLPVSYMPIQRLQDIMFEKLSVVGSPLILISVLAKVVDAFATLIEQRNQLINDYKDNPILDETKKAHFYFGTQDADGHIDKSYSNFIDDIYKLNDDGIMYCKLLAEGLSSHGEDLKLSYKKQFGGAPPKIMKIDVSNIKEGLVPSLEEYGDWTNLVDGTQ